MSLGQFSSLSLPLALSALAQAAARALLQTAVLLRSRCDLAFSLRNSGLVAYSVLVAYCVLSSIAHCIALALRAPERARSSRTWESKTLSHKRAKSARILGFFRNPCKGWGFRFSFSCALGFSYWSPPRGVSQDTAKPTRPTAGASCSAQRKEHP